MEICKQQSELNRDMQVAKRAKRIKGKWRYASVIGSKGNGDMQAVSRLSDTRYSANKI